MYRFPYDSSNLDVNSSSWDNHGLTQRTLLHLRFDEHLSYHRSTCFKKGCECRANFPMQSCDNSWIYKNIPDNIPSSDSPDRILIPNKVMEVQCRYLFNEPIKKFQYMIIQKRGLGSQYMWINTVFQYQRFLHATQMFPLETLVIPTIRHFTLQIQPKMRLEWYIRELRQLLATGSFEHWKSQEGQNLLQSWK